MKYIKYLIPMFIIFLTIGFAATNVTLSITGDAYIASDLEDFEVYISSIKLDGVEDITLLKSSTEFELVIAENTEYTIDFEVTNASIRFDADISISCNNELEGTMNDYTFSFNESDPLLARSSRSGSFYSDVFEPIITGETISLSCKIEATPIERTEYGEGEVPDAVSPWAVGREITLGPEKFNIISETDTTITMLASYNIGRDNRQSTVINNMSFDGSGWEQVQSPAEVNIQQQTTNIKSIINNYVVYLKSEIGDENLTGDLISLQDLKKLGCTIPDDYYLDIDDDLDNSPIEYTCNTSPYADFLINSQSVWTKSVNSFASQEIWYLGTYGEVSAGYKIGALGGIRPTITISKEALRKNIIEFTIEGETYHAYEGMTWSDWVSNSAFSNDAYYDDEYNIWYDDLVIGDSDNNWVYSYDEISNGVDYYLIVFCCFDAGSKVLMADGTTKNIEDVQVGDLVMSLNEDTGEFISQKVTDTIINPKSIDLVYVHLSNGVRIGMRAYHPLLTTEGWKSLRPDSPDAIRENIEDLSLLEVGDTLVGYGEDVTIVSIEEREEISDYKTYNLSVEGYHNYVVEGIVAHNVACVQ